MEFVTKAIFFSLKHVLCCWIYASNRILSEPRKSTGVRNTIILIWISSNPWHKKSRIYSNTTWTYWKTFIAITYLTTAARSTISIILSDRFKYSSLNLNYKRHYLSISLCCFIKNKHWLCLTGSNVLKLNLDLCLYCCINLSF